MMIRQMFLAVACLAMLFASVRAEQTTKPQTVGDDITPNVGEVCRGSQTIGKRVVANDGQDVGKVKDIVLDPFYGRVVSIVIGPDKQIDRTRELFIPVDAIARAEKDTLKLKFDRKAVQSNATSFAGTPGEYTRRLSLATFRHFDIKPYWLTENEKRSLSERDDRFVTLSQLKEQAIKSATGQPLGKIRDIVASKATHKIVYTLFAQNGVGSESAESDYPIPLACFAVRDKAINWKLELPQALLENTKSVNKGDLPEEISRAWVEYVHVRYGGGVLDGVQREQK